MAQVSEQTDSFTSYMHKHTLTDTHTHSHTHKHLQIIVHANMHTSSHNVTHNTTHKTHCAHVHLVYSFILVIPIYISLFFIFSSSSQYSIRFTQLDYWVWNDRVSVLGAIRFDPDRVLVLGRGTGGIRSDGLTGFWLSIDHRSAILGPLPLAVWCEIITYKYAQNPHWI